MKLMHSAAKDKAQNVVRQRLSNKKANTSGKEAVKCTRKERLEMTEEAYGEYLASSSLNDFYPDAWWTFLSAGKPAGHRRMLQCLNSGLPIKVIPDDKICPVSDTFRGSSRAMRRKQYERLQSKMRGRSFDSVELEDTPDIKHQRVCQDIALLEKQIALCEKLGEGEETVGPLMVELLNLIKVARGVGKPMCESDVVFETPI